MTGKRDKAYARSMNLADPADTFDAELLPSGKRRELVTLCMWCNTPIEQPDRDLGGMGWAHPDRYDVDCHGVKCPDGTNNAEPVGARVYDINGNYPDMAASNKKRAHQNRRAFAVANELGLGDMERRELAMMLPTQTGASGPVSWAALSIAELGLLADWMTGVIRLRELANLRAVPGHGD